MPVYYKGNSLYMIVRFTDLRDIIYIFAKMPNFGFLICSFVWACKVPAGLRKRINMSYADDVRAYCIENYIQPARKANKNEVTIRAGDVHAAMNLSRKLPLVCSALGANVFEQMANVKRLSITGPSNGANTLIKYRILNFGGKI